MKYLSVCSGIEAASAAWHPLGWEPVGFSEIEAFPCVVLMERWPWIRNLGDMNGYKERIALVDAYAQGRLPLEAPSRQGTLL